VPSSEHFDKKLGKTIKLFPTKGTGKSTYLSFSGGIELKKNPTEEEGLSAITPNELWPPPWFLKLLEKKSFFVT